MTQSSLSSAEKHAIASCPHHPIGTSCPRWHLDNEPTACTCPQRNSTGDCCCFMHHRFTADSPNPLSFDYTKEEWFPLGIKLP